MVNKDIKRLVAYYVKKFETRNPFRIADNLGVLYQFGDIGCEGCYMYLKKHRYIFLNANLDGPEKEMVMAHELGHAILHRKENCYFIRNKTFLSTAKIENEANAFAAELLVPDEIIYSNPDLTKEQIARMLGYTEMIMEFKNIETKKFYTYD